MKNKDKLLLQDLASIIENGKRKITAQVNSSLTLVYWQVGFKINTHILENQRAEYGKEIIPKVATQLATAHGKSFQERNLRRMMQFSSLFPDLQKLSPLATKLRWSHFVELLSIKSNEARSFYAFTAAEEIWSKRELRNQIERKAFERKEIAQIKLHQALIEAKARIEQKKLL